MFHSKMKMGDMMKTVIIDDDLEFARYLKDEINQCDMISMDIEINSYDDDFDLYFLDIDMPDTDGIAYARKIKNKAPHARIIFVSYRNDLVFDALHIFPFSFIRKEFLHEELMMVLKRIYELDIEEKKMLFIHEHLSLPLGHICYIEKKGSYSHVHTQNHVYKLRKSLNVLYALLNSCFVYINKGTIVHLQHVAGYDQDEIRLKDSKVLYMSRGRRQEVILAYLKYKEGI